MDQFIPDHIKRAGDNGTKWNQTYGEAGHEAAKLTEELGAQVATEVVASTIPLVQGAADDLLDLGSPSSAHNQVIPTRIAPNRITGDALAKMRKEFNAVKPQAWIDEAAKNAHKYTPDQLKRMRAGQAPIGADGFPMEIHHRTPLAEGGGNVFDNFDFLTRTDHRLGPNYKRNHPNLP